MEKQAIKNKLSEIITIDKIRFDEPMKNHISFKVGGPADFLVLPENCDEFKEILKCCRENAISFYVMGNGSNLLVRDKGYRGVIIKMRHFDHIFVEDDTIIAEPGALLKDVAQKALENNLSGMEFASGIPGSLGGAAVMNAGAYDGEMKDIIESIEVITDKGEEKKLLINEC
ncbi:MAG: FAD-binding protein, partial [Eubacterium sp.]